MTQERAGLRSLSANYRYIGTIESGEVYYPDQDCYQCLNCRTEYYTRPNKYCHECGVRFRGDPKSFRPVGVPRWAWDRNIDYERPETKPSEKVWVIRKYDRDCPDAPPKVYECHEAEPDKGYENTVYKNGEDIPRKYSGKMIIMKNLLRRLAELRAEEHRGNSIGFCEWEVVHDKYDVVLAVPPDSVTKSVFGPGVHNYLQNQLTNEELEERGRSLEDEERELSLEDYD